MLLDTEEEAERRRARVEAHATPDRLIRAPWQAGGAARLDGLDVVKGRDSAHSRLRHDAIALDAEVDRPAGAADARLDDVARREVLRALRLDAEEQLPPLF